MAVYKLIVSSIPLNSKSVLAEAEKSVDK